MRLEIKDEILYLEGMQLRGVEKYEIVKCSDSPKGKAELELKLIVEFPDNKQEQENYIPLNRK